MKKLLTSAAITAALLTSTIPASAGQHHTKPVRTFARFQYEDGHKGWSQKEAKMTIKAAVARWPVSLNMAMYVANRESGFYYKANNPTSTAAGIYQFVKGTWESAHRMFTKLNKWTSDHVYNARANILVAIKFVHTHSWSPWGF